MQEVHYNRICEIIRDDRTTFIQLDSIDTIIENFRNMFKNHFLYDILRIKKEMLDKKLNK